MTLNVLLIKNGNVVGMINLNSHRDRAFSPDDITLIYTVASIRFKLLRQGAVSLTSRVFFPQAPADTCRSFLVRRSVVHLNP